MVANIYKVPNNGKTYESNPYLISDFQTFDFTNI